MIVHDCGFQALPVGFLVECSANPTDASEETLIHGTWWAHGGVNLFKYTLDSHVMRLNCQHKSKLTAPTLYTVEKVETFDG